MNSNMNSNMNSKMNSVMNIMKFLVIAGISVLLILPAGCGGDDEVRSYTEKAPTPKKTAVKDPHAGIPGAPSADMMKSSHAKKRPSRFAWETPPGWKEAPNTSSMRVATFSIGEKSVEEKGGHANAVSCTIVPLKGTAGGLNANVQRWMGQLQVEVLQGKKLDEFLAKQKKLKTVGDVPLDIIDFTSIPGDPEKHNVSMMVGIIVMKDTSVFVKMTGHREPLVKNRDKFIALCRSIKAKE